MVSPGGPSAAGASASGGASGSALLSPVDLTQGSAKTNSRGSKQSSKTKRKHRAAAAAAEDLTGADDNDSDTSDPDTEAEKEKARRRARKKRKEEKAREEAVKEPVVPQAQGWPTPALTDLYIDPSHKASIYRAAEPQCTPRDA